MARGLVSLRMSPLRSTSLLLGAVAGSACFAVEKVDPGPLGAGAACESLRVDDFETGDLVPRTLTFGPWACSAFNSSGTGQSATCGVEPVPGGGLALAADFTLYDSADGIQDFPVFRLSTTVVGKPLDIRRFHWLVFNAFVESASPQLAPEMQPSFLAAFDCASAPTQGRAPLGDAPRIDQSIAISTSWQSNRLELDNFGQPPDQTNAIEGGAPSCLAVVNDLAFVVGPPLQDGESASGRLHLDNIFLYGDCQ